MFRTLALMLALVFAALPAIAQEIKVGDLTIEKAWSRATAKGSEVGVGYLTIHNNGAGPDKLVGGAADFAGVEIHEMSMQGGVMKMRELTDGLVIPAQRTITLAPSGYHLMFVHLKQPLVKGGVAKTTLTFEKAGPVAVDFSVQGIGAAAPADGMNGMKM